LVEAAKIMTYKLEMRNLNHGQNTDSSP